jgi:hypothetical protein
MRYIITIIFLCAATTLSAQKLKPVAVSASWFGETITHPGIKMGLTFQLKSYEKSKAKKNGKQKLITKSIDLTPSAGAFYHKNYQTAVFVIPELSYSRKNARGNYKSAGIGAGYMRTFVPNVYEFNGGGDIKKIHAGNNYFVTSCFITFGKELTFLKNIPAGIYIKPQLLYALPNYPKGVMYFALEAGLKYRFTRR